MQDPFVDTGAGYIKFPGNYDSSDILLITNTDSNEVIYASHDTNSGGLTELATPFVSTNDYAYTEDEDFPKISTNNRCYNKSLSKQEYFKYACTRQVANLC